MDDKTLPTKEQLKELQPLLRTYKDRFIIRSMFIETMPDHVKDNGNVQAVFTLKDRNFIKNGHLYYSLKNIYFSYDHIPGFEYEFAQDVFGSWDHWEAVAASTGPVKKYIDAWRDELTVKLQAKALQAMIKTATFEGSKGTPAARYLADRGWEVKRGRPSKEEVEREKKIAAGVEREIQEDMQRLGISVVK